MDSFTLRRTEEFCAAHFLPGYEGNCSRMHGHNFKVEAEVKGNTLDAAGMVIDFRTLKHALQEVLPDHGLLNDWMDEPPSSENIARTIYLRLHNRGIPVCAVTVWENDRNSVRYCDEPAS